MFRFFYIVYFINFYFYLFFVRSSHFLFRFVLSAQRALFYAFVCDSFLLTMCLFGMYKKHKYMLNHSTVYFCSSLVQKLNGFECFCSSWAWPFGFYTIFFNSDRHFALFVWLFCWLRAEHRKLKQKCERSRREEKLFFKTKNGNKQRQAVCCVRSHCMWIVVISVLWFCLLVSSALTNDIGVS